MAKKTKTKRAISKRKSKRNKRDSKKGSRKANASRSYSGRKKLSDQNTARNFKIKTDSNEFRFLEDFIEDLQDEGFDIDDILSSTKEELKSFFKVSSDETEKNYKLQNAVRYWGPMKAYAFKAENKNQVPLLISDEAVILLLNKLYKKIINDVKNSPVKTVYKKITFISIATKGTGHITIKGEQHDFEWWHDGALLLDGDNVPKNFKDFLNSIEKCFNFMRSKILDFENGEMPYMGENSSKAEEIIIEEMNFYAEYAKTEYEAARAGLSPAKKGKKRIAKNSGTRSGNKKLRKKRGTN